MKLKILSLYPNELNSYGDRGNLLVLAKRAEWRGLEVEIVFHHLGGVFPAGVDLVIGGGGPDLAQSEIQADLFRHTDKLRALAGAGVPMLLICGSYQLFCNKFTTSEGEVIEGIGIFDAETVGSPRRLIGNLAFDTPEFGKIYGFENHSGKTFLSTGQPALGRVSRGAGNNGEDKSAGARTNNALGTYAHGPILPNNPALADGLLQLALKRKGANFELEKLDDNLANLARAAAKSRRA